MKVVVLVYLCYCLSVPPSVRLMSIATHYVVLSKNVMTMFFQILDFDRNLTC